MSKITKYIHKALLISVKTNSYISALTFGRNSFESLCVIHRFNRKKKKWTRVLSHRTKKNKNGWWFLAL